MSQKTNNKTESTDDVAYDSQEEELNTTMIENIIVDIITNSKQYKTTDSIPSSFSTKNTPKPAPIATILKKEETKSQGDSSKSPKAVTPPQDPAKSATTTTKPESSTGAPTPAAKAASTPVKTPAKPTTPTSLPVYSNTPSKSTSPAFLKPSPKKVFVPPKPISQSKLGAGKDDDDPFALKPKEGDKKADIDLRKTNIVPTKKVATSPVTTGKDPSKENAAMFDGICSQQVNIGGTQGDFSSQALMIEEDDDNTPTL